MRNKHNKESKKSVSFQFVENVAMYKNDIGLLINGSPLYFFLTLAIVGINICLPFFTAYLTKIFVEIIELKKLFLGQNSVISLVIIVLIIFMTYFLSSLLSSMMEIIVYRATERLDDSIQQKLIEKSRKINYAEYEDVSFLNDLYKASDYSAEVLNKNLTTVIKTGTCVVSLFFICGIFKYSITVLGILLASGVLSTALNLYWEKQKIKLYNEAVLINRKKDYFEGCMRDPELIREFRGFNAMSLIREKYAVVWDAYIKAIEQNEKKGILISILNQCTGILAYGVSYIIIIDMCFIEKIDISEFIYLITMLQTFTNVLKDALSVLPESKRSGFMLQNYNKIIMKPSKIERVQSSHLNTDEPIEIEFRNVSFKYPMAEEYTLKNISFVIKENSLLGIVGPNGAGKSTLVKLMLGLYEPTEGDIFINGQHIKQIIYEEFLDKCSVIFQDYSKYATTVKENIYLGNVKEEICEDKIKFSGKKSGVNNIVAKCEKSWNQELTKKLTEEGIELSGGEWQRLALAKAFYKNARLIILDEPTASLDPKIEHDLFSCVDDEHKTRIIISHRLGNMIYADKIILLDGGIIKETGTHVQLMQQSGEYAKMYRMQSSNYQ